MTGDQGSREENQQHRSQRSYMRGLKGMFRPQRTAFVTEHWRSLPIDGGFRWLNSHRKIPKLYTSDFSVHAPPLSTSGAKKAGAEDVCVEMGMGGTSESLSDDANEKPPLPREGRGGEGISKAARG